MSLATVASVVGIAGGVSALMGDSGGGSASTGSYNPGGGQAPPFYTPTGQGGADQQWQQIIQQLMGSQGGVSGQVDPALLQSFQAQMAVDPRGYAAGGAQAGQAYGNAAGYNQGWGYALENQATQAGQREQALWNAGADPQSGMYNQQRQQVVDSSRAADSARGLAMSPYSSGNESTALTNFQNQWDYGQLQRMLAGGQGANQAGQMYGADLSGASQMLGTVPGLLQQAQAAPIQGAQQAAQQGGNIAATYGSQQAAANSPWASIIQQIIPYLNYGTGATGAAYGAFGGQQANQQQQGAAGMNALLTGGQGLAKAFNSPDSWLSGGAYSGAGSNNFGTGGADPYSQQPAGYYGDPTGNMVF